MRPQKTKLARLLDKFLILRRIGLIVIVIAASILVYHFLITYVLVERSFVIGITLLWFATAYLVLPRIHRLLTKIYLPDYFIGRTRTGDGLLGDPVNLAVISNKNDLVKAMKNAGWQQAEELNAKTTLKMIKASILHRSYPTAPVSSLYLFNKKQDLAFQQEVGGNTKKRHHVRFWRCPEGWLLPGGFKADYLGAATYDRAVGFSVYTFQITHKIEEDTDIERDYVTSTLVSANSGVHVKRIENFSTGYHHRNGGGDTIKTDGALPFITIP